MRPRTLSAIVLAGALSGVAPVASAQPVSATAERSVEPVVLKGAKLPTWSRLPAVGVANPDPPNFPCPDDDPPPECILRDAHHGTLTIPDDARQGVPVEDIVAFRFDAESATFQEIPVQVDEMFPYFLANGPSDFSWYSGTDKELTYEWDVEAWKMTEGECVKQYPNDDPATPENEAAAMQDPVLTFDDDDEIVFMAGDAGPQAPASQLGPLGTGANRQEISITDPLTGDRSFVYLFLRPGGSGFNATNGYVRYERDANADEWIDKDTFPDGHPENLGSSNEGYGPNMDGTVCNDDPQTPEVETVRQSDDRFARDGVTVTTDSYRWYASGRWMVRRMQVADPVQPDTYGPDLIDRWKGRAFQQSPDSGISAVGFEDEQVNWEGNSSLLGELAGPVRAIREIWGADSGTNVTKTETFYRDAVTYRFHVRVHPIPPDGLYTSWDYNSDVATHYWNQHNQVRFPDGVPIDGVNDDAGNVDAIPLSQLGQEDFPAFFDAPDPTFSPPSALYTWEQISGKDNFGSLAYIWELSGATTLTNAAAVPYYRDDMCLDDGTGDDPVPRPEPGVEASEVEGYENQDCTKKQRQGAFGSHGLHAFVTQDSDNANTGEPTTEIDIRQWQFAVPTETPEIVAPPYTNTVVTPLQTAAVQQSSTPNTRPTADAVTDETDEDRPTHVILVGRDKESCDLTFEIMEQPEHGNLGPREDRACDPGEPNRRTAVIRYAPDSDWNGTDRFIYRVSDGSERSDPVPVTIRVHPVDEAQAPGGGGGGGDRGNDRPNKSGVGPTITVKEAKALCAGRGNVTPTTGTAGADRLIGTPSDDVLCGLDGRDVLVGGGGNDVLVGGGSKDLLTGGKGNDLLLGGPGADTVLGGPGSDSCHGGKKTRGCEEGRG
jgi:Bacterial Ig domain/RTX calcium-binding nonapeptide repeat (4 copies)